MPVIIIFNSVSIAYTVGQSVGWQEDPGFDKQALYVTVGGEGVDKQ